MASSATAAAILQSGCRNAIDDEVDTPTSSPLSTSSHLTRRELLRRRLTRTRNLSRVYRIHFWSLMDHLRIQFRHYYWTYGVSPISPLAAPTNENGDFGVLPEGCGETDTAIANNFSNAADFAAGSYCGEGKLGLGLGFGESGSSVNGNGFRRCSFSACELKAMALTSFCYLHILSDPNQKLYKPCNFVIKAYSCLPSPEQGQIFCGRPILSSAVPSLCNIHLPKALNDVKQALRKAGLTAAASGRLAPKFHVVVAEYVKLIQSKRRAVQKRNKKKIMMKKESGNW